MGKFELKFKSPFPIEYLHRKAKFDRTPRILGKSSVGKNRFINRLQNNFPRMTRKNSITAIRYPLSANGSFAFLNRII